MQFLITSTSDEYSLDSLYLLLEYTWYSQILFYPSTGVFVYANVYRRILLRPRRGIGFCSLVLKYLTEHVTDHLSYHWDV